MVYYQFKLMCGKDGVGTPVFLDSAGTWENVRYLIEKKIGCHGKHRKGAGTHIIGFMYGDFLDNKYRVRGLDPVPPHHQLAIDDLIILMRKPNPDGFASFVPIDYRVCTFVPGSSEEERLQQLQHYDPHKTHIRENNRLMVCDVHPSCVEMGTLPRPHEGYECHVCGSRDHFIRHCSFKNDKDVVPPKRMRRPSGIPLSFLQKATDSADGASYVDDQGERWCSWKPINT